MVVGEISIFAFQGFKQQECFLHAFFICGVGNGLDWFLLRRGLFLIRIPSLLWILPGFRLRRLFLLFRFLLLLLSGILLLLLL